MAKATIGGVPIIADTAVRWKLREGVLPVIEDFHIRPIDHARLLAVARGRNTVELVIDPQTPDGAQRVRFQKLYIIGFPQTDNPHVNAVRVADLRWLWPYTHVLRKFNIRRRVGAVREVPGPGKPGLPPELQRVFPQVWYAQWSLHPDRENDLPPRAKWKSREVLTEVIRGALQAELRYNGRTPVVAGEFTDEFNDIPVEDLIVDDSGENAVRIALQYFPEMGLYVDEVGNVRIYPKAGGEEEAVIRRIGAEIMGEGHVQRVANDITRPSAIRVLFQREVEVRFDYQEVDEAVTTTIGQEPDQTKVRFLENVVVVPDFRLQRVTDAKFGAVQVFDAAQGTYISLDSALRAWSNVELNGGFPIGATFGGAVVIDHFFIQRAMVPFMDLWTGMALLGQAIPDADWTARIAAIKRHYRRTFRINQRWLDRIASLRAYRVHTADPVHGSRARAVAYADYALLGSQRSFLTDRNNLFAVMNIERGLGPGEPIEAGSVPAPADVVVTDSDQGIIDIEFSVDPFKVYDSVLPGRVARGSLPTADIFQPTIRGKTNLFNARSKDRGRNQPPRLEEKHKMAVILTCIPASPTGKRADQQLHPITVLPGDIRPLLPAGARDSVVLNNGPVMDIKVNPSVEVARIRWRDSSATEIEKIFGLTEGEPNLEGLVINEVPGNPVETGANIISIAQSIALRVYARLHDRLEGSMSGQMKQIRPEGWIDEVQFNLETTGEATTQVSLPEQVPEMDLFSFLDDATRRVIARLPQPPVGQ